MRSGPSALLRLTLLLAPLGAAISAATASPDTPPTRVGEPIMLGNGNGFNEDSPLRAALKAEMDRDLAGLTLPDAPPLYRLRYYALDLREVSATASFGDVVDMDARPVGVLGVEVRVGSPSFDNTGFGGWETGFTQVGLPCLLTPRALRVAAWKATDWAYKEAVEQYARKASAFHPPPDYPGDFEIVPPSRASLAFERGAELAEAVEIVRALSRSMPTHPVPRRSAVLIAQETGGQYMLDSEGTEISHPVSETTVRAIVHHVADDGMLMTDHRSWMVRQLSDLPPIEEMAKAAAEMSEGLAQATGARTWEEEYVGPVLFEDEAAADFFRTLLVPQLEGTPPPVPFESLFGPIGGGAAVGSGRPGDVRIGRRVLPQGWSVVDDPLLDPRQSASFAFDVEGSPARAVHLVQDGIVRTLLMSRTPRKGLEGTNGHARGTPGHRPAGRAAMTRIEPERRLTRTRLQKKALDLARAYGRDYVFVVRRFQDDTIRDLEGGGAYSDSGSRDTMALPVPLLVFRVFRDGREEPVRGMLFSGENRFVLRDIVAAGPQVSLAYLAPFAMGQREGNPLSGLPTWISAPEILVGEMELMPMIPDKRDLPVIPPPGPYSGVSREGTSR